MSPPFDAVIVIAHGARDARWLEPFVRLTAELAQKLQPCKVGLSFMEFATPSFPDAVAEVHRAGARRILIAPFFLSGGGHVAHDIPKLVSAEKERYPEATFAVCGAIGEEPEVAAAMIDALVRVSRT